MKGCCAFSKDDTEEFVRFAEANKIKPVIAKTFEFRELKKAFEEMQHSAAVGKFVVKISDE